MEHTAGLEQKSQGMLWKQQVQGQRGSGKSAYLIIIK